jgi:hypothetical protein
VNVRKLGIGEEGLVIRSELRGIGIQDFLLPLLNFSMAASRRDGRGVVI